MLKQLEEKKLIRNYTSRYWTDPLTMRRTKSIAAYGDKIDLEIHVCEV